jgi:F-type H+-transporting ATPase subunit a
MPHVPSIYDALHIPVLLQSLVLATIVVLLVSLLVNAGLKRAADGGVIPEEGITYMPLVGTLGFFILVSNLMGLVPGVGGPTSFVETNLAWALIAFLVSEAVGIREHGLGYVKHFMPGPAWISWMTLPIELLSHLIRIVSLTIRLTANMFADHTLLAIMLTLPAVSWFIPFAVMGLGVFVSFVQAFIFTFLTMIYIGQALEHAH